MNHYSPRIVYSINLAKNTNDFLLGLDDDVDYGFNLYNPDEVARATQELVPYCFAFSGSKWALLTELIIEECLVNLEKWTFFAFI